MGRTAAPASQADTKLLSLKVTLRGIKPPIWRRILMPASMTLDDLHVAIQRTMGWEDSHLHDFDVAGERYGDPTNTDDVADESRLPLSALVEAGVHHFAYTYDFGDNWEHTVLVEKSHPPANAKPWPACTAGKRRCPPEDCGGTWGYADLLQILANPAHPQHEEQREWAGEEFDPDAFSVVEADAALAAAFRRPKH